MNVCKYVKHSKDIGEIDRVIDLLYTHKKKAVSMLYIFGFGGVNYGLFFGGAKCYRYRYDLCVYKNKNKEKYPSLKLFSIVQMEEKNPKGKNKIGKKIK